MEKWEREKELEGPSRTAVLTDEMKTCGGWGKEGGKGGGGRRGEPTDGECRSQMLVRRSTERTSLDEYITKSQRLCDNSI